MRIRTVTGLLTGVATCALCAGFSAGAQQRDMPSPPPLTESADTPSPTTLRADDSVDPVLRAQILLDRAHFSPGEIDGRSGSNTRRALAGFQASRNLTVTASLDDATLNALGQDASPVLVDYTLGDADVAGPFLPIPSDMMEKAALPALGYSSVQEALGEKFHCSPTLLESLNPGKSFVAGESIIVPAVLAGSAPLPKAARVVVDKSDATVSLVDAAGVTYAQFPATMGSVHDPLPLGEWAIQGVGHNPTFHYNPTLFWDANPKHAKATIQPGPNNPVGVVWIDLSKDHYGIHGTPEPSTIGKTASHGCIRLTNWDAMQLSQSVAPATPALFQE
jgi:lipoprotein-anchoring transpeptidase ErfK/SrfK